MKKLFQEDVDPVCDELRAAGMPLRSITGSLVWTKLGGVGSRSTAYDMVRNWKERRADKSVVQPLIFSDEGRRDLVALVERIAGGELDMERQATAIENAALHDEADALRHERDDLVRAMGEVERLSEERAKMVEDFKMEVADLKERLRSAELEAKILGDDRKRLMAASGSGQPIGSVSGAHAQRGEEEDGAPGLFDQMGE